MNINILSVNAARNLCVYYPRLVYGNLCLKLKKLLGDGIALGETKFRARVFLNAAPTISKVALVLTCNLRSFLYV